MNQQDVSIETPALTKSTFERVQSVEPPPWFPLADEELFESSLPNIPRMHDFLSKGGKISPEHASKIVSDASHILRAEPNLIHLYGTFVIVGDIHGQYYDLHQLMLREWTSPVNENSPKWIFLGDYVDRGSFGLEVVLLLFAYKINFPKHIILLRGNHELRTITEKFNFKEECTTKYDLNHYDEIMNAFDCLPLACVLSTKIGNYFAVHGGISPEIDTLDQIDSIDRFAEPDKSGPLCDLLWGDPLSEDTAQGLDDETMKEWLDVEYCENPTRGVGQVFGYKAIKYFLGDNGLDGIIRGHETAQVGYIENFMKQTGRSFPCVVTVFSAPNYCGWYNNKGAIMLLKDDGHEYKQFDETNAPYVLPASLNCCSYTLPWIAEHIHKIVGIFFGVLLDQMEKEEPGEKVPDNVQSDIKPVMTDLRRKVRVLSRMAMVMGEVRKKNETVVKLQGLYGGDQTNITDIQLPHDYDAVKNFDTPSERSPLSARKNAPLDNRFWRATNRSRRNSRERGIRLLISHEVDEAYFEVRDNTSKTDWAIFGYEEDISPPLKSDSTPTTLASSIPAVSPKLIVRTKGSDGLKGMLEALPLNQRAYVYFRTTSGDGMSIRAKFVLIHWVPENIHARKRAEVSTHKGFVKEVITECSVEIHATEVSDIVDKLK